MSTIADFATVDPITQVYQRLRSVLYDRYTAKGLVRPGNFKDMSDVKFLVKQEVQPGDLPEVIFSQGAFVLKPFGVNSRVATIVQAFPLIVTLDKLTTTPANVLKFHALVALLKAGDDIGLPGLVRQVEVTGGADDPFGQQEWKRSTERLVTAFVVQAQLDLDRRQLLAM